MILRKEMVNILIGYGFKCKNNERSFQLKYPTTITIQNKSISCICDEIIIDNFIELYKNQEKIGHIIPYNVSKIEKYNDRIFLYERETS